MSAHAAVEETVLVPVVRVDPNDSGSWQLPPVLQLPVIYHRLVDEHGLPVAPVDPEEQAEGTAP